MGLSTQRCCLRVLPGPGLQGAWDQGTSPTGHLEPAVEATASVFSRDLLVAALTSFKQAPLSNLNRNRCWGNPGKGAKV